MGNIFTKGGSEARNKSITRDIKRIAIIGGGPAGFGVARALIAENAFDQITIFEQRAMLGGVWNYQEDKNPDDDPTLVSAMYKDLVTNLPYSLMEYLDTPFPSGTESHPHREKVLDYVERYCTGIEGADVRCGVKVVSLKKATDSPLWTVVTQPIGTDAAPANKSDSEEYDAVVIANGHNDHPYVPSVPGLADWKSRLPNTIRHSKYYNTPDEYKGKKVLVVGAASSGLDILTQLLRVTAPVYLSSTSPSWVGEEDDIVNIGRIAKYDVETRSVEDVYGNRIDGIDIVIFCTGYLYAFPFMEGGISDLSDLSDHLPITDGHRVYQLYRHIFYIPEPTMAFAVLPRMIIPFPLAESQGAVIGRVWSGRLSLPSDQDMRDAELKEVVIRGEGRSYHSFTTPEDVEYYRYLAKWAAEAVNPQVGFQPDQWPDDKCELRERSWELKKEMLRENIQLAKKIREGVSATI
jgi:cation diffusion facilitator CzcD-associated flavoprotein CzcO